MLEKLDMQRSCFLKGLGQWQPRNVALQRLMDTVKHADSLLTSKSGQAVLPPFPVGFRRNFVIRKGRLDQSYTDVYLNELFFK